MDTKLKEILEAKNPLIYASNDDGLEISFRGSVTEIMSLVGTLILSVSNETGIPLDSMYVDLISASTVTLKQYEEQKERKACKNKKKKKY